MNEPVETLNPTSVPVTLEQRLLELTGPLPAEDVVHALVPLMRAVAALHSAGRVAALGSEDVVDTGDGRLVLVVPEGVEPCLNEAKLRQMQPHSGSALRIVGEYRVTTDSDTGTRVEDLRAASSDADDELLKPAYQVGYRCWEYAIGHHDELTDVFSIGLILASLVCDLDFNDEADVTRFSAHRTNPFVFNRSLHPVIASLIGEMTALNRHERASDLAVLADRLQHYREQPAGFDVERVLAEATGVPGRRVAVLSHLRDRLFDLSRRNRLIHFRPSQGNVNFTVASVPVVMRLDAIRPEQLCTWNSAFARDVLSGRQVSLAKWLRFEDQPYLSSAFDRILQEAQRDRAEYGYSHLRLVVAFLHWHNLKDAPHERITSPLLWLPVEFARKKGVRDQYLLRCADTEAEFNPVLRHYLRQIYDIQLPETVDLTQTSIETIHADLVAQIQRSEPGVNLALTDKPAIRLVHQKAVQRLRNFQRRRGRSARSKALTRPDFSYDRDDYRPLGLALFETYVKPSPLPQRIAVGAAMPAQPERMLPGSGEAESLAYSLARGEGHRFSWEIDLTQVTLANFNYKKMSLVRDYNQLIDERSVATSFDHLFSIEPRALEESAPELLPSAELWGVVPADATQEAAVALARTGRSFIIQGPPGTGKSQTITNLIADYAARNKRVLFVCEKRAALDVVFNRLRLAGLGRLACLIHDSQEDKKAFVADLRDCYENWSKSDDTLDACRAARERTIAARDRHLGRIEAFEKAMTRVPDAAGQSLRVLVRRLIALPEPVELGAALRERLPAPVEWDAHRALAERLHRAVADAFGLSSLAAHPFARLSHATVAHERSYAEAEQMLIEGERLFDALDSVLEGEVGLLSAELTLGEALRVVQAIRQATGTNLAGNLALLDPQSEASADFNARREEVGRSHARLAAALEASSHWTDPLSSGDTRIALEQARRQETSLFKFLNGAWRRLKRTVRARYDFAAHAVEPSIVTVLEQLAARHEATEADEHARQLLNQRFGTTDGEKLAALRDEWTNHPPASVSALLRDLRHSTEPAAEMARVTAVADAVEALGALATQHLEGAHEMTLMALAETIRDLREALEDLPDLLPLLGALDAAGERFAFALRTVPLDPAGIEALVLHEAIVRAFREEPALQRFDAADLASSARRAARARTILQQDNGAFICAAGQHRFRSNVRRSSISVSQLDTAGREFKKLYTTGRRELEHEFGKTMRYRSIRDLADGETGAVASDLKPIWLMSPLSVSDTLPLRHDLFDVVIFDEASQIPTEEAVPALSRAPQVIVVGDEMQLPPTSFFSVTRDEEDTQVSVEEDGEALAIQLDADSLLNQAARTLPATLLAWHYRSRSEALISFSNAAFYDGRLITIPDRTLAESASAPEPLHSEAPEAAGTAVERMLARAISFHPVADGVYDKRTNLPEARLIAGMVRDLLARGPGPSIGIVAFSEAQQGEIESALEALAADDASFAARLEQEYAREDDGQINSLFVKNLENVQGDERDIILLSICYAPDRKKRMTMTFGPINQRGGEKRLNVIFSRARQHMAVVSTIRAEAITNTHNDGARALRTFLAFADAQSRGDAAHGQAILATLNPEAQRVFARVAPPDALRHAIAEVLRARGHTVQTDVGSASFRCDLAIVAPDGRSHALGILLDAQANGRTEDRYVFQPAVLRRFGWKVIDIPSNSWLRDEDAVLAQIEAALRVDPAAPVDDDPFEGVPASVSLETAASRAKAELADRPTQEPTGFTELRFQQGISDKFWKIAAGENDVTIVFGRMGTKGTTTVKTFETAERAKRETAKLIAEKLRKGYVEVSGSSTMTGTLSPELDASDSA